jgi:hypothetical protein
MKRITAALALLALASPALAASPDEKEWIQLFDGKTLNGWTPKIAGYDIGVNYGDTFRAEHGVIKVSYDKYDTFGSRFGHLFYKTPFSHYVVAVEYRFVGDQVKEGPAWAFRNSGIMFHGQPLETMKKDQDFPICVEAQFLGGRGDGTARSTANLCTPGTHVVMNGKLETTHCINSSSKTYDGDQWVRAEIEVHGGGQVVHRVNGETVLRYEQPQIGGGAVANHDPAAKKDGQVLTSGTLSLQAESHPVEFRKVELLNLVGCVDKKAKNYKIYYEKDDRTSCKY